MLATVTVTIYNNNIMCKKEKEISTVNTKLKRKFYKNMKKLYKKYKITNKFIKNNKN